MIIPNMRLPVKSSSRDLVARFVDDRQRAGKYVFTSAELAKISPQSPAALRAALRRLSKQRRIVRPLARHDFFVIVPHEHYAMGAPPSAWYVDALMRYLGLPDYYIGLLSAAQWHGATHFAVQETQVVAPKQLRPIRVGGERIRFITKKAAAGTPVETRVTEVGSVRVSTPEATAVDLVRYLDSSGGLGMAASAIAEMRPHLSAKGLLASLGSETDLALVQRLGYLLTVAEADRAIPAAARWLAARNPRVRPLDSRGPADRGRLDKHWRLIINAKVEGSHETAR